MSGCEYNESNLLSFGYCHEYEIKYKIIIPNDIKRLLTGFITKYKIIGIGENYRGQLSVKARDINEVMLHKWTRLKQLESVTCNYNNIYINSYSLMVIDEYNKLYVCGSNQFTRLGVIYADNDNIHKGINITIIPTFKNIASNLKFILASQGLNNSQHTFVYSADNQLYASGVNGDGQFGNGKRSLRVHSATLEHVPRFWRFFEKIKQIHCAQMRTFFLMDSGNVYACGWNGANSVSPSNHNDCITVPQLIYDNIKAIALGVRFNILLTFEGKLIIFGGARLGDENSSEIITSFFEKKSVKIKEIQAGYIHALVLSEDNKCYSFGDNYLGQCGIGYRSNWNSIRPKPNEVMLPTVKNGEYVVQIACGQYHNLVLTNWNNVYSFGYNHVHQCLSGCQWKYEYVLNPYLLDKKSELGLDGNAFIERVMCINHESIIIINPNKTAKIHKT